MPTDIQEENPHKTEGVKRIVKAFGYSMEGLATSFRYEAAFRQEVILAAVLLPIAIFLPVGLVGKILMIASVVAVLVVELLNSALEWTIDYISMEKHPYAKRVKDMGSAAVFLSLWTCGLVWLLIIVDSWETIAEKFF